MPKSGWKGDAATCATALYVLFAPGDLEYRSGQDDAPDDVAIVAMTPGLLALFALIPKGNGLYSTFVRAILEIMKAGKYGGTQGGPMRTRMKKAQDQAMILRTICFHIRREWYRRSKKLWMIAFPNTAPSAGVHPSRAVPVTPPGTRVEGSAASAGRSIGDNASALLINSHGASWGEMDEMFDHNGLEGEGEGNDEYNEDSMSDDDDDDDMMVWLYGFDADSRKAWRALVDCKNISTQRIGPYK